MACALVVDDDARVRHMVDLALRYRGHEVYTADDGAGALELAGQKHPDVIVLDVVLPDMDGFQVCQKLRADPDMHSVPIIFLAAKNQLPDKVEGFEIGGNDYNIVHSKWQVIYQIDNAREFFRNVYVEDAEPGEVYFDVVKRSTEPLFKNLIEDAVVTALVNYTVDDITSERMGTVTLHVKRLIQERLDELESGIKVESVNLLDSRWPRQVNDAFEGLHKFSQVKETMISQAHSYAQNKLIESQAQAEERIAQARANRTKRVETARANAEYLQQILPEYRKRPKLIIEEIYLEALEKIFANVDEQFIVESTDELRLLMNRDPGVKKKSEQVNNPEN